ncbi:MAG: alpha/beta hydrolase [Gammaproteobacteria bacterium]
MASKNCSFGLVCLVILGALMLPVPGLLAQMSQTGSVGAYEAKFVDVNGLRTRYYEEGAGEAMLLVHGSGYSGTASANTWYRNLPGLAERFHVFAADKLASGMTDNPSNDEDFTIRSEVAHMVGFIRSMGIAPVHLVGQSRGAGLSFLLAANHPELIKTLVLVDSSTAAPPAGDERPNRRRRLFSGCSEDAPQAEQFRCRQTALSYSDVAITDEYVAAAGFMWDQPKARETRERVTPEISRLNAIVTSEMNHDAYHRILTQGALAMPVLLYWAKNDPSVLPAQAYSFYNIIAESNPRAWLLFVNRAGHFHYQEKPEEFNRNVINFVTAWDESELLTLAE